MTSKLRAVARVAQKKLGFRYRVDVIPLDASLVRGSHGLRTQPNRGPLVIGPKPQRGEMPSRMTEFKAYVRGLLGR
jgi:hypothetical protein